MKTFYSFLFITGVLVSTGCTKRAVPSGDELASKLIIEVKRSPCYGDCPVYDFRVYSNSFAELDAQKNTNWVGAYSARLSTGKMSGIKKMFQKSEFFTLEDSYSSPATDLPTTEIYYKHKGQEKTIKVYGDGPEQLKTLIEGIVETVDDIEWKRKVTEM